MFTKVKEKINLFHRSLNSTKLQAISKQGLLIIKDPLQSPNKSLKNKLVLSYKILLIARHASIYL